MKTQFAVFSYHQKDIIMGDSRIRVMCFYFELGIDISIINGCQCGGSGSGESTKSTKDEGN